MYKHFMFLYDIRNSLVKIKFLQITNFLINQGRLMQQWLMFQKLLRDSFRDLLPIIIVILFFQLVILQTVPEGWENTATGLLVVGIGLAIFLQGLEIGIFPVGESLAKEFSSHGSTVLLIVFGFLIGYGTTIAEPALVVIAEKASAISSGRIDAFWLRQVVALSVGAAISLGVFRIIVGHAIHYYIIAGYVLVAGVTFFAPVEIVGLAYDLGGVTTSTVTVPLVAALGIGLASNIKGRNPVIDGFGLIAFASLTPMIFVQVYGIFVYALVDASDVAATVLISTEASQVASVTLASVLSGLLDVFKDVVPILAVILFFHYVVLKKPVRNLTSVLFGFGFVVVGLYAFIIGLELGLFSLGETMAFELTKSQNVYLIYSFGFAIGFATTMAEPALMAIAKKAKEISDGKINDFNLRAFVATGVAIGISLGCYRIVQGDSIHYYIIAGYALVVILTYISPKYIVPIAFDSGGVTTSTVTVPLVAALGIGLASSIPGRSPLIDGFGLIAFASLFPMITVMMYGIITEYLGTKGDKQLEAEIQGVSVDDLLTSSTATVNVNGKEEHMHLNLAFAAVIAMVPEDKKEDAILAAQEVGAGGVTILSAEGAGLHNMANIYRALTTTSDACLLFIVPESLSAKVVNSINSKMHLSTIGAGLVFSMPISHMRGVSIAEEYIKDASRVSA